MRLIGLLLARNEEHEIGLTLRAMLRFCDCVQVMLHACTDMTYEIVSRISEERPYTVSVSVDQSTDWDEMRMRQSMLQGARWNGATHIWMGDADEILTGNLLGDIRRQVEYLASDQILQLPGYNLRGSLDRYHNNGVWGNRWFSVAFKDNPALHWQGKRLHHREPMIAGGERLKPLRMTNQGQGGVMHLWAVQDERLRAKHRLYRLTERLQFPDTPVAEIERMYSWATDGDKQIAAYGTSDTWTYSDVPSEWWATYQDLMEHYHPEIEPWQTAECERIIAKYERERFAGLRV